MESHAFTTRIVDAGILPGIPSDYTDASTRLFAVKATRPLIGETGT